MRDWVYGRLSTSLAITNTVGNRIRSSSAAGQAEPDTNIVKPFIMVRMGPESRAQPRARVTQQAVYIYFHNEPGSMLDIDAALLAVRGALTGGLPQRLGDGRIAMECSWDGDSDDLYDDVFRTAVRYATFTLTAAK